VHLVGLLPERLLGPRGRFLGEDALADGRHVHGAQATLIDFDIHPVKVLPRCRSRFDRPRPFYQWE